MGFDAGALLFKIQAVGAQLFRQDMREAKAGIEGVEQASTKAKGSADGLGKSQDDVADKAKKTKAPLDEQAKSTRSVGDQSEQASKKQDEQAASAEKQRAAAQRLAAGLVAVGLAASAMVGLSIAKFTEFDKQMSNTSAATMDTAAEQRQLSDAALDAGADTAYSATEAAAAEEELAKAGQSVANITGGSLKGSLALAAAGQLEVARSAEIMATVLTQFRLPAEQAGHVADVLAAGAGKAQGSVDDLSLALSYVGPLAASMGWSLEETAGTLAYFSTQGIAGEKAGTALRGVIAALQSPSEAAKAVMQEYGVSVYGANGHMLAAAPLAQQLKDKLSGLTDEERQAALGRIFGNESLLGATLLYEGGAKAVATWTDNVNDAAYASDQAAMKQDNLAGDIEKLGGAFDTALIKSGSGANAVLRDLVQTATGLVDIFGDAPEPVQQTALALGIAVGAATLLAGATIALRARWEEWKTTLSLTNGQMARSALIAGGVGIALAAVATVVAMVAQAQAEGKAQAEAYASTLESGTNRVTKATRDLVKENLAASKSFLGLSAPSVYDQATKLGISLETVTDAAMGNADALKTLRDTMSWGAVGSEELRTRLEAAGITLDQYTGAVLDVENGVKGTSDSIDDAIRVAEQKQRADAATTESTKTSAQAYVEAADSVGSLEDELRKLIDTILEANGVGQDAVSANIDYQNALAKVDETIRKAKDGIDENNDGVADYTLTLDTNTQAGRDNTDMLVDLAKSAQDAAEKQYKLDGDTDAYRQTLESSRQALIDRATDLGMNADQAHALADEIFKIPSETEWKMIADTQQAAWTIEDFKKNYGTLSGTIIYRATLPDLNGAASGTGRMGTFANGGVVHGYANGGVRFFAGGGHEHHVAQIARAGAMRVWAEPETGGETYLPHAMSKRAGAERYMAETASIFGGVYIPAAAAQSLRTAPVQPAQVQIVGAEITGRVEIGGDGLARLVDARIVRAQVADDAAWRGGVKSL